MNKPDWNDVPDWVQYIAMDQDGNWTGFEHEPILRNDYCNDKYWAEPVVLGAQSRYVDLGVFVKAEDTLEKRPDA